MKVHLCKTLWGVEAFYSYDLPLWTRTLQAIKAQGYGGLEVATAFFSPHKAHQQEFLSICKDLDLKIVT